MPGTPLAGRFVGRDRELGVASRLVRDVAAGQPSVLIIEGEAGIGKTRLVDCLVEEARASGMTTAGGAAHPFERARPFGAVAAALELTPNSDDPRRAAIGRLLSAGAAGPRAETGHRPDLRYRVVEEMVDLVEVSCLACPTVVVIEDLHWADHATLYAVRMMARGLVHVPLLLVVTARLSPRSADLDQLAEELAMSGGETLRLGALSPEEIGALARCELDAVPGQRLGEALARCGGNPLLASEMLRSLADEGLLLRRGEGVDVTSSELPSSLSELVVRRLRYLPEGTLELLRVAAVLGDTASVHDVTAVAHRPAVVVAEQLAHAFAARLLDGRGDDIVFRHQLVHDAIYQQMPVPVRRLLHREAAGALADAGADLVQVADHLVLGAGRGDVQAVGWLRDAAAAAGGRAPQVCLELLRRAEALLPGGHAEADLLSAELVQALLRAGRVTEAVDRAEAVLARRHRPDVDGPLRLTLLAALSLQNRPVELTKHAGRALDEARLSRSNRALVLAQSSYGRTLSGDVAEGERTARRALEVAARSGATPMVVWSLTTLAVAVKWQGRYGDALGLARRAVVLASECPQAVARMRHPKVFLGMALCDSDRVAEARTAYHEALDDYESLGSVWLVSDARLASAAASFVSGEWDDAVPELEEGVRVAEDQGNQIHLQQAHACLAVVALARNDLRRAEALIAPFASDLGSDAPCFGAEMTAQAASMIAMAKGDLPGALDLLSRYWRLHLDRGNRYFHRLLGPDLVRAAVALGAQELAHDVTAVVEAGAALAPEVPTVASNALRCRGLAEQDPEPLMQAVELARGAPRLVDHAGTCEDAAELLAAGGGPGEAKALLLEARERYEDAGATAWAARVGGTLRRLGVRQGPRGRRHRPSRGWESLTATEAAVSRLVAEGLTNREVARRLHISPHTVNTHLRHVFQKLSVPNRAALAAVVVHANE